MSVTIETTRKVFNDDNGAFISVGVDDDSLGLVQITTSGKLSEDEFGKCRLVFNPEFAKALANAILATIPEVKLK